MTDATQVLKPGWRALDANGDPLSGAVLEFDDAGTTNDRTVYADKGLSTALGTSVTCDSGGYPASDGNAKVEIYTGSSPYKVTLKTSAGSTVWSHDNVVGALDTSGFLTDSDVTPSFPVVNTSSNQTPSAAEQATFYNVNCSGGDVSFTIDNAADCGDGWLIKVRHDGTANQVTITGTSSETFKIGGRAGVTGFALTRRGQTVTITCDGTGFHVEETSPGLFDTTGVILVADRLSTPPGSPQAGARYIVGSSPTDDWSGFGQHDIAEYSGTAWFAIVPPADCGWIAYVQDEDDLYLFKSSAWASLGAALLAVAANVATQSQMEAASSAALVVPPGRQHHHPGHPKAWVNFNGSGTLAVNLDYGVASVTDNGTGDYTVNFDTAFSGTGYAAIGMSRHSTATAVGDARLGTWPSDTKSTSACQVRNWDAEADSASDSADVAVVFFGDFA